MMFEIEDVPVTHVPSKGKTGLTYQLSMMKVGQSVLTDKGYNSAYQCIRAAKGRLKNPLVGEFSIVPEGDNFRVGRTA